MIYGDADDFIAAKPEAKVEVKTVAKEVVKDGGVKAPEEESKIAS